MPLIFNQHKRMRGAHLLLNALTCLVTLATLTLVVACDDDSPDATQAGERAGASAGESAGAGATGAGEVSAGETGGALAGEVGGASCMSDEACPSGARCDLESMSCVASCERDSECGANAACIDGLCIEQAQCDGGVGGTCAEGQVCSCMGLCLPLTGNPCQGDLQCQVSEYCDLCQGQCRAKIEPCGACDDSASCERSGDICAPVGQEGDTYCLRACVGQGSCDNLGPGYLCESLGDAGTFCVPEAGACQALTQCERDAECDAGFFCNERAQCQPGCENDTTCSEGLLCQGLRCAPPCTADSDCSAEGAVCEGDGRCRIPGGCQSSRDCAEPETYCDLDTLRCVSGCQVDNDCQDANQECVHGACQARGCTGNFQCGFGQVCELETGTCVMAEGRHCEAGCDPMNSETSCGTEGQRCLSLQDEEENPIGDFCFEPCEPEPNACPQGYSCQELQDPNNGSTFSLCIRTCEAP